MPLNCRKLIIQKACQFLLQEYISNSGESYMYVQKVLIGSNAFKGVRNQSELWFANSPTFAGRFIKTAHNLFIALENSRFSLFASFKQINYIFADMLLFISFLVQ